MILILLFLIFLTTGCWNSREVEDLALVPINGFDRVTENGIDKWLYSVRIISPVGERQQGDQSAEKSGEEIFWQGTGASMQDASVALLQHSPRSAFYGHLECGIIGERAAREGIADIIKLSMQYWEVNPRMYYLVVKGDAYNVLQTEPELVPTLAKQVTQMADKTAETLGLSKGVPLREIAAVILSPDRDGVLPQIKIVPEEKRNAGSSGPGKTVVLDGLAVIRGDKLVGWLNREETRGYLLITQKLSGVNIMLPVKQDGQWFTYPVGASKSKIEPKLIAGNKLQVRITIQTQGVLVEAGKLSLNPAELEKMEASAAETIRELALKAIGKAQEYDADFLGIMQELHRHDPAAWQKIQPHWRETFRDAEVEVEVTSKIASTSALSEFQLQK